MRRIVGASVALATLIAAPAMAADMAVKAPFYKACPAAKHAKPHYPKSRVVVRKAPALWPGADAYAPAAPPRHCDWIGPGARASWTCR